MQWTLVVLLLALAQEPVITIAVATKDGNTVTGTTEASTFIVESSLGKTPVSLKDISTIQWVEGFTLVSSNDGTALKGKVSQESWTVKSKLGEFTLKSSDIQQISVLGVRMPAPVAPPRVAPAAGNSPPPGANPAATPKAAPGLKPAKVLKIGSAVSRSIRSADGKKMYLLDASDSKVLIVNLETFELEKAIALAGGESSLSLAPSGTVLVAGGKRTISAVSLAQGKLIKTFTVEFDIADVCAIDDQTVVAGTNAAVLLISVPKQAVISKTTSGYAGRIFMAKDGKRIYTGIGSFILPDKSQGREEMVAPMYSARPMGANEFSVSPDGRFAAAPSGTVFRLGKSPVADLIEAVKIEPHWSSAWAPATKRLFIGTSLGFVKEYDTETWELSKSWRLGYRFSEVFVDEKGTAIYGVGHPVPPGETNETMRYPNQSLTTGDLLLFEIPKD